MSLCVLGHAEEFKPLGIAVNALWPRTVIQTAALQMIPGIVPEQCRSPQIVADAAHAVLHMDARSITGQFFLDEDVLRAAGVTDFEVYRVVPGEAPLLGDLFI